jgi:hypothetical protein
MLRTLALMLVIPILLTSGCTHQVNRQIDYDHNFDFSALKTYSWDSFKESGTQNRTADGRSVADIVRDAVDSTLSQKGYVQATDSVPSFRVHVFTQLRFNRSDVPVSDAGAIAQSRAQAAENPIPASPSGQTLPVQYSEGTLVIDMIDPATGKSIWRGAAVGVLREQVDPADRARQIDAETRRLLAGFPPK